MTPYINVKVNENKTPQKLEKESLLEGTEKKRGKTSQSKTERTFMKEKRAS